MYNVNDIVWLKKDCKDIEEYLLNHRLVIVGKNGEDNIAISDDYMTFVLCREEPKIGIHKGNKFFDIMFQTTRL